MMKDYPEFSELALADRAVLHPLFRRVGNGISEFTFANLYLFREKHSYRIARLGGDLYVVAGQDGGESFFMLPFGLCEDGLLADLFDGLGVMRAVSESQSQVLAGKGYVVAEDRDNFDYLYSRRELVELSGRKFHKKKNHVNAFLREYDYEGQPLREEYREEALAILEGWAAARDGVADYVAAKEALENMWELQLCGGIYYVEQQPVAYTLGEENAGGSSFLIHFEKAIRADEFRGIYQFVNQAFASILPEQYETINREQDLGDAGLRQAKQSYNPVGFVKKWRAWKAEPRRACEAHACAVKTIGSLGGPVRKVVSR